VNVKRCLELALSNKAQVNLANLKLPLDTDIVAVNLRSIGMDISKQEEVPKSQQRITATADVINNVTSPKHRVAENKPDACQQLVATVDVRQELAELERRRLEVSEGLAGLERQIHALEGSYLEDTVRWGNIARGWEGYLAPSRGRGAQHCTGSRKFKENDRLFSRSSVTNPGVLTGRPAELDYVVGSRDGKRKKNTKVASDKDP
jgi:hypothetical protein